MCSSPIGVSGGCKTDSCGGRKSDSRQHGLAAGRERGSRPVMLLTRRLCDERRRNVRTGDPHATQAHLEQAPGRARWRASWASAATRFIAGFVRATATAISTTRQCATDHGLRRRREQHAAALLLQAPSASAKKKINFLFHFIGLFHALWQLPHSESKGLPTSSP